MQSPVLRLRFLSLCLLLPLSALTVPGWSQSKKDGPKPAPDAAQADTQADDQDKDQAAPQKDTGADPLKRPVTEKQRKPNSVFSKPSEKPTELD